MARVRIDRTVTVTGDAGEPLTFRGSVSIFDAMAALQETAGAGDAAALRALVELLVARVVGWSGVEDDTGAPAPCTPENRREFFAGHVLTVSMRALQAFAVPRGAEPATTTKKPTTDHGAVA